MLYTEWRMWMGVWRVFNAIYGSMVHETITGWWFGTFLNFPFSWGFHTPNWLSLILFRRVGSTTNQTRKFRFVRFDGIKLGPWYQPKNGCRRSLSGDEGCSTHDVDWWLRSCSCLQVGWWFQIISLSQEVFEVINQVKKRFAGGKSLMLDILASIGTVDPLVVCRQARFFDLQIEDVEVECDKMW